MVPEASGLQRSRCGVGRLITAAFRGALWTLSRLSLRAQRSVGRTLGRLAWYLPTDAARVTRANLALCFPDLDPVERRRLGCRSLEHTGMLAAELGAVYRWPTHRWRRLTVAIEGEDQLASARATGRGVLVLVPHFGNWEHLALVLGAHGVTALYDPPRIAALEPVVREARARAGATLLPIDAAGMRAFYRALADGGVVALLPDQVPDRRSGIYADFFGVPALTMTLVHRLVRRARPQVLLGAALRCPGGFRVTFRTVDERIAGPDPAASAAAMNQEVERLVRLDPAQYQWEYKRFKRQPPGQPPRYARR